MTAVVLNTWLCKVSWDLQPFSPHKHAEESVSDIHLKVWLLSSTWILQRERRAFILLNILCLLNSEISNVCKTCNYPYSIITCFPGNVYALKYIFWLDFSLLLPHFCHKGLVLFFNSRKSQLCSLEILHVSHFSNLSSWKTGWALLTNKQISIFLFFFLPQRGTFKLSDFPMVLSDFYFTFCAHLNFGKHFSIDLQCNIKLQNQNAVNEIAGKNCLFILHLWVHLFFLFFHLPLLTSQVKQQLFT